MGWGTLLAFRAALLLVVTAQDCPLNVQEEHAWLIRITPMLKHEEMEGEGGAQPGGAQPGGAQPGEAKTGSDKPPGGDKPASDSPPAGTTASVEKPAKVFKFFDGYDDKMNDVKRNPHHRYKRQETTAAAAAGTSPQAGDTKPSEGAPPSGGTPPAGQPGATVAPAVTATGTAQPNQPGGGPKTDEPGVTVMHGALITTSKVLTTTYNEDKWMFVEMKIGYLSLAGYNKGKGCMQEQWGKEFDTLPHAAEFPLNAGKFALVVTHEPFAVEGEPFLFGSKSYPDVAEIIKAYNNLTDDQDATVQMYLFKDNRTKTDGSTFEVSVTTFKFIPWKACQKIESFLQAVTAVAKGTSPRVTMQTYFCSMGIPGILNETMDGETDGFGTDWYQGAPVLYEKLPLGQYVYRTGKSGNPRIYATYSSRLSEWLGGPQVLGSLTVPPPDADEQTPKFPNADETFASGGSFASLEGAAAGRGQTVKSPDKPTSGGRQNSMSEFWAMTICAFSPAIRVFYKP